MKLGFVRRLAKNGSGEILEVVPTDRFGLVAQRRDVGKSTILESDRMVYQVHQASDGLARSPVADHTSPTLRAFVEIYEL